MNTPSVHFKSYTIDKKRLFSRSEAALTVAGEATVTVIALLFTCIELLFRGGRYVMKKALSWLFLATCALLLGALFLLATIIVLMATGSIPPGSSPNLSS